MQIDTRWVDEGKKDGKHDHTGQTKAEFEKSLKYFEKLKKAAGGSAAGTAEASQKTSVANMEKLLAKQEELAATSMEMQVAMAWFQMWLGLSGKVAGR